MDAGNFKKLGTKVKDIVECLHIACNSEEGNIAYLLDSTCFSVTCHRLHSCDLEPLENVEVKTAGALYRIIGTLKYGFR